MEIIGFLETGMTASNGFYCQVKGATCQDSDVFEPYHEKSLFSFSVSEICGTKDEPLNIDFGSAEVIPRGR
jgi:hypothetical protein